MLCIFILFVLLHCMIYLLLTLYSIQYFIVGSFISFSLLSLLNLVYPYVVTRNAIHCSVIYLTPSLWSGHLQSIIWCHYFNMNKFVWWKSPYILQVCLVIFIFIYARRIFPVSGINFNSDSIFFHIYYPLKNI